VFHVIGLLQVDILPLDEGRLREVASAFIGNSPKVVPKQRVLW
jgi:hypothetical protein